MERWRATPYPGYQVSSFGRVKGPMGQIMSAKSRDGRHRIVPFVSGRRPAVLVRRLVCEAFHGPPVPGRHFVFHLDRNRDNLHADNLCWGSREDCDEDKRYYGQYAYGELGGAAKLTERNVREIRASHKSIAQLAAKYGVSKPTIYWVLKGKSWRHLL